MSRFPATTIDLSSLPKPALIETVSFDTILSEQKADVVARFAAAGITFDTAILESETISFVLRTTSYREMILRSLVNAKALQVLLAFADGSDLNHIGARFGVLRMAAVDAPRDFLLHPEDWESDTRYRARIQLAPDAYSNAGTLRAYQYHVLSATLEIAAVSAFSPEPITPEKIELIRVYLAKNVCPGASTDMATAVLKLAVSLLDYGRVDIICLGADGAVSDAAITAAYKAVMAEDVKPLTDDVRISNVIVKPYTMSARLLIPKGPDPAVIKTVALNAARAWAYSDDQFAPGAVHYRAGMIAALKVPNVKNVILSTQDFDPGPYAVAKASFDITTEIDDG